MTATQNEVVVSSRSGFVFQQLADFQQLLAPLLADFGIAQVQPFQGAHDDFRDGQPGEPIVIGGNDEPRRPFGAGTVEAVFVGVLVIIPERLFPGVGGREFPVLLGSVDPFQKPLLLFLLETFRKNFRITTPFSDKYFSMLLIWS